jgi:hypothetical protein
VLCELDAGTNFEILAERGCEKQQAATQAVVFSALLLVLRLTSISRPLVLAVLN